jgi:hypothetical protein
MPLSATVTNQPFSKSAGEEKVQHVIAFVPKLFVLVLNPRYHGQRCRPSQFVPAN